MNKKILVITDMDSSGSGYKTICVPLFILLGEMGYEIKISGLMYRGEEHTYPFSIIPARDVQEAVGIANNLMYLWNPDLIIVAMDIPLQINIFNQLAPFKKKYIAITPLENPPLTVSWAMPLFQMDKVFFISELGKQEALKVGMTNVEHLQVGVDTVLWHPATPDEKKQLREGLGIPQDAFVVLTVADNQERKNLWAGLKAISLLKKEFEESQIVKEGDTPPPIKPIRYILVTREQNPYGWKLRDLIKDLDIRDEVIIFERGLPQKDLWGLYAISDVYLQPSKAEGLCVLPNTRVWTDGGLKNIQDVSIGDWVFTNDGSLRLVDEVFVRNIDEDINIINIGFGLEPIKVTKNHPVLSVKCFGYDSWRKTRKLSSLNYHPANELQKGDFIFYPKPNEYDQGHIYISDYVDGIKVGADDIVRSVGRNQFGTEFIHPSSKDSSLLDTIKVTPEFCSLLGWYVAEGCDTQEGVSFSLHWDEVRYREQIRNHLKNLFNLELHDNFKDRNRYDGRAYGKVVGNFFSSMCGKDATTKHLPSWALFLDDEKTWALLESMFCGDGTFNSNDATLRYSTSSKELSRQLQFILFRMGIVSSVRDANNRQEFVVTIHRPEIYKVPFLKNEYIPQAKKLQSQFIELDNGWLIPIRSNKLEKYVGVVYNLEVQKNHSYLLAGGVVHNCLPVMDAMACDIPVVATDTGALHELLDDCNGFLISPEYEFTDVWGNENRSMINIKELTKCLFQLADDDYAPLIFTTTDNALESIKERTWDIPAKQLDDAIRKLLDEPQAQ